MLSIRDYGKRPEAVTSLIPLFLSKHEHNAVRQTWQIGRIKVSYGAFGNKTIAEDMLFKLGFNHIGKNKTDSD